MFTLTLETMEKFLKRLFRKEPPIIEEKIKEPILEDTPVLEEKTNKSTLNDGVDCLPDDIYAQVNALSFEGDRLAENLNYALAINSYNLAWELLPEPKNHWNASTWLLAASADSYFLLGENETVREALQYGMTCPNALGNPFLHLRLGQAQFNLGNENRAADELLRAYMGGVSEIFEGEDRKYFDFLKTRAIIDD